MLRLTTLAFTVVLLSGCQSFYEKNVQGNLGSPYYRVPVDSRITLKQQLTIPAHRDRIYLVDGQVLRWQDVNIYRPYCMLQVATVKAVAQTVKPTEFVVQRVFQDTIYQLALQGRVQVAQIDKDGGVMEYRVVVTVMELFSENEPEVIRLTCGRWELPPDMPHVTINDIHKQLGSILDLTLATKEMQRDMKMRRTPGGSGSGY
ncbi:MAG: hypothetical protein ACE5H7_14440 [Acidiferrobacterales bacterium]